MKKAIIFMTLSFSLLITNVFSQAEVMSNGKFIIGESRDGDDPYNFMTSSIFGPSGTTFREGARLSFGDNGVYERWGINLFIGEYTDDITTNVDSDQLQLHGKNGIYLTRGRTDDVIGYYDVSQGDKFYFNTPVYSNGVLLSSDERFKRNIKEIDNTLIKIQKLKGVSYHYDFSEKAKRKVKGDRSKGLNNSNNSNNALSEKESRDKTFFENFEKEEQQEHQRNRKIGFLAQDLKEVYPNLVSQDKEGYYYVDYTGLIPVIVESIKQQQNMIEAQSLKIKRLEKKINSKNKNGNIGENSDHIPNVITNAFLYQNTPNPFTNNTEISYFLPKEATNVALYIFDWNGSLIKNVAITETGKGSITINGLELKPGMYFYTLLINGIEVDTKRMILTN